MNGLWQFQPYNVNSIYIAKQRHQRQKLYRTSRQM